MFTLAVQRTRVSPAEMMTLPGAWDKLVLSIDMDLSSLFFRDMHGSTLGTRRAVEDDSIARSAVALVSPMASVLLLLLLLALGTGVTCKQKDHFGELTVTDQRVRPAAKGRISAAYFTVRNFTTRVDALQGVACSCATAVEMHRTRRKGFNMHMVRLRSLPVPAGAVVELKPGGDHVMLIGLKKDLKPGDTITLELRFARAGVRRVSARVGTL